MCKFLHILLGGKLLAGNWFIPCWQLLSFNQGSSEIQLQPIGIPRPFHGVESLLGLAVSPEELVSRSKPLEMALEWSIGRQNLDL